MSPEQAYEIIKKESCKLGDRLTKKGVPVESIDVDFDDIEFGEPFAHIHINLDNDWFYGKDR